MYTFVVFIGLLIAGTNAKSYSNIGNTYTLSSHDARSGGLTKHSSGSTVDERFPLTPSKEWEVFQGPLDIPIWHNISHPFTPDELAAVVVSLHFTAARFPQLTWRDVVSARVESLCYAAGAAPEGSTRIVGGHCDAFIVRQRLHVTLTVPLVTAVLYSCAFRVTNNQILRVTVLEDSTQLFDMEETSVARRRSFLASLRNRFFPDSRVQNEKHDGVDVSPAFSLLSVEVEASALTPVASAVKSRKEEAHVFKNDFAIQVISQNIWNYNGNWSRRFQLLASDFDAAKTAGNVATVLTLQEVRYHSDFVPVKPLTGKVQASHFWSHWEGDAPPSSPPRVSIAYHPATTYLHLSRFQRRVEMEGPAIAVLLAPLVDSRYAPQVLWSESMALSRDVSDADDAPHQRRVLCSAILIPSQSEPVRHTRVDVCTSHFSLSTATQKSNAEETLTFIRRFAAMRRNADLLVRGPSLTVFTGDLNGEPDSFAVNFFKRHQFVDLWEMCNNNVDNESSPNPGHTFNSADSEKGLTKRIDFMLVRQWDEEGEEELSASFSFLGRSAAAEGDGGGEQHVSSDHLGISSVIKFTVHSV